MGQDKKFSIISSLNNVTGKKYEGHRKHGRALKPVQPVCVVKLTVPDWS